MRKPDFFLSSSVMPRVATVTPYPTTPKPAMKGHIFFACPAAKVIMLWFWYGIASAERRALMSEDWRRVCIWFRDWWAVWNE